MTLAQRGLGTPNADSAAAGSLFFVAPATPGGPAFVWRLNVATLILDLKRRMGSPDATNTAYGPSTHTGARELAIRYGAPAGDVPPALRAGSTAAPSSFTGGRVPASVLRVLAWLAYVQPFGVPLSAVELEAVTRGPQWGVRAPGGRVEVTRTPVDGGAAVAVTVPMASVSVGAGGASASVGGASASTGGASTGGASTGGGAVPETGGASTGGASTDAGRTVTMPGPWHLRAVAQASSAGAREYPAGERVVLLSQAPESMTRGDGERGYRVRVVSDSREGFAFVPVSVLQAAGVAVADAVAGGVGAAAGAVISRGVKVAVGLTIGAGVLVVGGLVVASSMRGRAMSQRSDAGRPAYAPPPPSRQVPATRYAPAMEPPRGLVEPPRSLPGRAGTTARRFPRVAA